MNKLRGASQCWKDQCSSPAWLWRWGQWLWDEGYLIFCRLCSGPSLDPVLLLSDQRCILTPSNSGLLCLHLHHRRLVWMATPRSVSACGPSVATFHPTLTSEQYPSCSLGLEFLWLKPGLGIQTPVGKRMGGGRGGSLTTAGLRFWYCTGPASASFLLPRG